MCPFGIGEYVEFGFLRICVDRAPAPVVAEGLGEFLQFGIEIGGNCTGFCSAFGTTPGFSRGFWGRFEILAIR